jgi:outer membrane immunogenic protein
MKKIVIALTAMAALTGTASAADLAARPYTKAPVVVAPVANWTGCYVGGGGGGAYVKNDHNDYNTLTGVATGPNISTGADGWFGTVQAGCDYQFGGNWVVGLFGDYDFMSVRGDTSILGTGSPSLTGSQKLDSQWSVGGRAGYLVLPQLLTYVSGEYALSFLPGLFWKTEYRYAQFDRSNVDIVTFPGGVLTGNSSTQKFTEHSVRSELVYRFNWGGAVVAKY